MTSLAREQRSTGQTGTNSTGEESPVGCPPPPGAPNISRALHSRVRAERSSQLSALSCLCLLTAGRLRGTEPATCARATAHAHTRTSLTNQTKTRSTPPASAGSRVGHTHTRASYHLYTCTVEILYTPWGRALPAPTLYRVFRRRLWLGLPPDMSMIRHISHTCSTCSLCVTRQATSEEKATSGGGRPIELTGPRAPAHTHCISIRRRS